MLGVFNNINIHACRNYLLGGSSGERGCYLHAGRGRRTGGAVRVYEHHVAGALQVDATGMVLGAHEQHAW